MTTETEVLLISPPNGLISGEVQKPKFGTQPIGLAYLASYLEREGRSVAILDAYTLGLSKREILDEVARRSPSVVGLTSMSIYFNEATYLAKIIKEKHPNITVVVGGPHVSAVPEEALAQGVFDYVVIGEGEETLAELVQALEQGPEAVAKVPGIAFLENGKPRFTDKRPYKTDLDDLPFPSHHLLPHIDSYNPYPHWGKHGRYSTLITSRGCPYGCFYCSVSAQQGRKYRYRSPENVIEEIAWLNKDYGVGSFSFRDGTMTLKKDRLETICDMLLSRGLNISWNCTARVNEVEPRILTLMQRAGCKAIQYGIETGDEVLIHTLKKTDLPTVTQAIRWTHEAGIQAHGYFMFGLPDETLETMRKTIGFAKSLPLHTAGFSLATPFPGTELWDWVTDNKLLRETDWHKFDVVGHIVFNHPNLDEKTLVRFQKKAYWQFYFRPKMIMSHLRKNITSIDSLKGYLLKIKEKFA